MEFRRAWPLMRTPPLPLPSATVPPTLVPITVLNTLLRWAEPVITSP